MMVMLNLLHLAVIKICRMCAAMTQLLYFLQNCGQTGVSVKRRHVVDLNPCRLQRQLCMCLLHSTMKCLGLDASAVVIRISSFNC